MAGSALESLKKAKERMKAGAGEKPKPKAFKMDDGVKRPPKLLIYGPSGTGKTFTIVGLLLAGERVFAFNTDFGSDGLVTVKNELKRLSRLDLLKNLYAINFGDYEEVADFLENPLDTVPDLYDWAPTVLVWEGFTSYNVDYLDEYILKHAPGAANAGELRHAGFTHTEQDWQGMKRGTMRGLRNFIAFRLPTGEIAKVLTALEDGKPSYNELTGETGKGPLVHGGARKLMAVGFDVILNTYRVQAKGKKAAAADDDEDDAPVKYFYRAGGSSEKYLVKSRGYDLKPIEPADPERIWRIISEKGGGTSEPI